MLQPGRVQRVNKIDISFFSFVEFLNPPVLRDSAFILCCMLTKGLSSTILTNSHAPLLVFQIPRKQQAKNTLLKPRITSNKLTDL